MAAAEATAESAGNEPAASESSGAQDLVLKILGAIGTGVGVLGFVTLFGGAILWIRAEEAGLPANDAVSVIPNSVLVTTGASFLVPAVLLALLAVACIFTVHLGFDLWRKFRKGNRFKEAQNLLREAEAEAREAEAKGELAQAARTLANSLAEAAELAEKDVTASTAMKERLAKDAQVQRQKAEELEADAQAKAGSAADKRAKAENFKAESESARVNEEFYAELVAGGLILFFLPLVLNSAIRYVDPGQKFILVLVAAGVVAVSLVVYATSQKFVWFGVVAFLAVGVYIGFATYFRTVDNAKVEPVAALRTGYPPVVGIFVADTSSNLYLGSFSDEKDAERMIVVPRAQVTDLAIGPLVDPEVARKRAIALALERCQQEVEVPKASSDTPSTDSATATAAQGSAAPPPGPEAGTSVKPACSDKQMKALRELEKAG